MSAWISNLLVQNMTYTVPWDCNMLAHPELQKTAREEVKGIPFSSCSSKCPLFAARNLQRSSYKAMLVKAEQSVLTQEENSNGKKKITSTPLGSINCETEVKNIMNSSEVISQAAE